MSEQLDRTTEEEPRGAPAQETGEQISGLAELHRLYRSQADATNKLTERMDEFNTKLSGIGVDLGVLRGSHARDVVLRKLPLVADHFGFQVIGLLSPEDVLWLTQEVAQVMAVPPNELDSFTNADAIIEVANQSGDHEYVALEISFTVTQQDDRRATRNAEYIKGTTGIETYPAVAGVHILPEVEGRVEAGEVLFYRIPARELEPD